jgi:hypothetical protein
MDADLLKIIFIMGSYITILDVFKIHHKYHLGTEAVVNMYLHHILIIGVMVGSFFKNLFLQKIHLALCLFITTLWFSKGGCIMTMLQNELIPYTKEDREVIEGDYQTRVVNHLFVIVPVILYDFYKILM